MKPNRLINENSPYLLQHANNPVDWYPWCDEAFEKARKENKPVFLSIGYSSCHWCHVMAHESFEDVAVGEMINKNFVPVKVDREERPDIDNIYMSVCQLMTGGGGWPLTVLMTHDKRPFFAGTYFSKETKFGRMGLLELIPKIVEVWNNKIEDITNSAQHILSVMNEISNVQKGELLSDSLLKKNYDALLKSYDEKNGGFGRMTKFPTPHNLMFLLRVWKKNNDEKALEMVENTLVKMRNGGIFDHLGKGFHRYSTDAEWIVPHFEKMLYDQAMISLIYLEAFQATGKQEYADVVEEIFDYVLKELQSPEGGFYSAEDADSEGEEGKFYLWPHEEISQTLTESEQSVFYDYFNISQEGNFIDPMTGQKNGLNILYINENRNNGKRLTESEKEIIKKSIDKLKAKRDSRKRPFKDTKILTDWNALMITALAIGARILNNPLYADSAKKASDFILKKLSDDLDLFHCRMKKGNINAFIDDYAYLIWSLIELYEINFDADYITKAIDFTQKIVEDYWDEENYGFFFTAADNSELFIRGKVSYDNAIPSGNSVMMYNFIRLYHITGENLYAKMAEDIGKAFSNVVERSPSAFSFMLIALSSLIDPPNEIIVAGNEYSSCTKIMNDLQKLFLPERIIIFKPENKPVDFSNYLTNYKMIDLLPTIYICKNHVCNQPVTDLELAVSILKK